MPVTVVDLGEEASVGELFLGGGDGFVGDGADGGQRAPLAQAYEVVLASGSPNS